MNECLRVQVVPLACFVVLGFCDFLDSAQDVWSKVQITIPVSPSFFSPRVGNCRTRLLGCSSYDVPSTYLMVQKLLGYQLILMQLNCTERQLPGTRRNQGLLLVGFYFKMLQDEQDSWHKWGQRTKTSDFSYLQCPLIQWMGCTKHCYWQDKTTGWKHAYLQYEFRECVMLQWFHCGTSS